MQQFATQTGRLNKFAGEILGHAMPVEVLSRQGRHRSLPKNHSDTLVMRRYLPFGATSTNGNTQNRFYTDGTGDRGNVIVQQHQMTEGVTPSPDTIVAVDVTVVVQEYGVLYGLTNKTYNLHEDNILSEMSQQIGERTTFVGELIMYGALRGCTNNFYGGTGTSQATVNGGPTVNLLRKIVMALQANHAKMVTKMLRASALYDTSAVAPGYYAYVHTDLEPAIMDLAGFTPVEKYASGSPQPNEFGKVGRIRFISTPDLPSIQDAGAAVGATGLYSTSSSNIDLYPMIIVGQDAWCQVAVRGINAMNPTLILPGVKTKSDPLGQRGYAGTSWWKAGAVENNGWMAIAYVGRPTLS